VYPRDLEYFFVDWNFGSDGFCRSQQHQLFLQGKEQDHGTNEYKTLGMRSNPLLLFLTSATYGNSRLP
jgi:hypothetical protein